MLGNRALIMPERCRLGFDSVQRLRTDETYPKQSISTSQPTINDMLRLRRLPVT